MTDRELLEAAAKAAGMDLFVWGNSGAENFANMASPGMRWNPLTDDGDALRLAVKLGISVIHEEEFLGGRAFHTIEAISPARTDGSRHCEMHSLDDDGDSDPMAIVRGCIVRAAASLPSQNKEPS